MPSFSASTASSATGVGVISGSRIMSISNVLALFSVRVATLSWGGGKSQSLSGSTEDAGHSVGSYGWILPSGKAGEKFCAKKVAVTSFAKSICSIQSILASLSKNW